MNRATIIATQVGETTPTKDSGTPIKGTVRAVHVQTALSCLSDNVQVTVKTKSPEKIVLGPVTIEAGSQWYNPRELINDVDGTEVEDVYTDGIPVHDFINVSFSGGEDGDEITVDLLLE